jgi:hypothetical protein
VLALELRELAHVAWARAHAFILASSSAGNLRIWALSGVVQIMSGEATGTGALQVRRACHAGVPGTV